LHRTILTIFCSALAGYAPRSLVSGLQSAFWEPSNDHEAACTLANDQTSRPIACRKSASSCSLPLSSRGKPGVSNRGCKKEQHPATNERTPVKPDLIQAVYAIFREACVSRLASLGRARASIPQFFRRSIELGILVSLKARTQISHER
jgi:hypothetical protein